jgi:antibiotic biosynthesis monooxygenase (ABM) superfamily enzyme
LFVADYQNSVGYTPKSVRAFFDGYVDYLDQLAIEEYGSERSLEQIFSFDNAENLEAWYGCFESCPFKREV